MLSYQCLTWLAVLFEDLRYGAARVRFFFLFLLQNNFLFPLYYSKFQPVLALNKLENWKSKAESLATVLGNDDVVLAVWQEVRRLLDYSISGLKQICSSSSNITSNVETGFIPKVSSGPCQNSNNVELSLS